MPHRQAEVACGSFAVFKMIETDVVGFDNCLQSNKDKIDPELLAAKICGRWRNGVPLALSILPCSAPEDFQRAPFVPQMNKRLSLAPPKVTFATISGIRILPISEPSES
jgi:hypothetical protein